jgi:hypothetical protein
MVEWKCITKDCLNHTTSPQSLCHSCAKPKITSTPKLSIAELYPKYYKSTEGLTEIDVYAVHKMFNVQDPSGALQHASKKLLLSGVRTGKKSQADDIREARDTLTRWLELYS